MASLREKNIILGVCGGIAAFKAVELLRLLTQAGAVVDVIMTAHATRFVGEATMRGLSGRPVLLDLYDLPPDFQGASAVMPHLTIAEAADLALIVPATANTLAKMAWGMADNALTTTLLSVTAPIIVAPGMDHEMWLHEATQRNVNILKERGVHVIGPVTGPLARGNVGAGRLSEPEDIVAFARSVLSKAGGFPPPSPGDSLPLAGRHVLVTAGGTREPIDPVRYITNRSSGKMGFAVARAAKEAGARVTLVYVPDRLAPPEGCQLVPVTTAAEMHDEVIQRTPQCDVIVMAAAVADFRAEAIAEAKIKKLDADGGMQLRLVPNPDIAARVGNMKRDDQMLIIFAAETGELLPRAREKMKRKKADMVVANDVSKPGSGFEVDTNEVAVLLADGDEHELPLMTKDEVARHLVRHMARFFIDDEPVEKDL